jgi:hypothetical protein
MDTALPPDDHPVTVTWTTTAVDEHTLTLPYGELREAVNELRDRYGRAHHPDLADDLDLLEMSWLGDYEEDGSAGDFERSIVHYDLPALPRLAVFTVSLDDAYGDDHECAHTYVLHAPGQHMSHTLALAAHADYHGRGADPEIDPEEADCVSVLEGEWWTFPGVPSWPATLSGRTWMDLRGDEHLLERAYRMAADK